MTVNSKHGTKAVEQNTKAEMLRSHASRQFVDQGDSIPTGKSLIKMNTYSLNVLTVCVTLIRNVKLFIFQVNVKWKRSVD